MCGIGALLALPGNRISPQLCAGIEGAMGHRGPDASGLATFRRSGEGCNPDEAEVALIHRRLSIIDLDARSNQPMLSADGRFALCYNGEIYNYIELREELSRHGHTFRTTSDSEVLIAAYAQWGEQVLDRFDGMFAFVLLDRQRNELFMARDPFGIKPLFWAKGDTQLALASEIGPLLDVPGVSRKADQQRICLFLSAGQTDEGERTMFANVRSLPAGHFARISVESPGAPKPVQYWRPKIAPSERSREASAREVREAILESVKRQLRSDVPVGIALSGGIDSSAILACARLVGGPSADLRTFSFTATGSDVDETPFIDIAAKHAGARQEKVRIAPAEIVRDVDKLVRIQGEPFGSLSMYAQHRVMRLARDHGVKVILEGQGADELFAGYRPYLARRLSELLSSSRFGEAMQFIQAMRRLPGVGKSLIAQAFEPAVPPQLRGFARLFVSKPLLPNWIDSSWFARRGYFNTALGLRRSPHLLHDALVQSLTTTVLPALLRYGDRNSMAFSIESRVPFLTPALAEIAYSLPSDHLVDAQATSKAVLREAMRGIVPDAILDRKDKIAFSTPDRMWASELHGWFVKTLSSDTAGAIPWLKADAALKGLTERTSRSGAFGFDFWRTINVVRWIEQFNVEFA